MLKVEMTNDINEKEIETASGTVIEALPNTEFKIEFEGGEEGLAYLAGKMRKYRIRVLIGDKVKVELNPYGGKGRIIQRM